MKLHIHTMWGESNWLDMPAPIFDNEDLGNIWYLTKTRTFLFQRRMICRIKQAIWVKQNAKSTFASSTASAYHWMKRNYENNQRFLRSQHCLTGTNHLGQRIHTRGLLLWALAGTDQSSSLRTLEWCFFDPRSWWPPAVYRQQGQGALADFFSLRKATLQCWYLTGEGCVGGVWSEFLSVCISVRFEIYQVGNLRKFKTKTSNAALVPGWQIRSIACNFWLWQRRRSADMVELVRKHKNNGSSGVEKTSTPIHEVFKLEYVLQDQTFQQSTQRFKVEFWVSVRFSPLTTKTHARIRIVHE